MGAGMNDGLFRTKAVKAASDHLGVVIYVAYARPKVSKQGVS
jgi:hypothetical protein